MLGARRIVERADERTHELGPVPRAAASAVDELRGGRLGSVLRVDEAKQEGNAASEGEDKDDMASKFSPDTIRRVADLARPERGLIAATLQILHPDRVARERPVLVFVLGVLQVECSEIAAFADAMSASRLTARPGRGWRSSRPGGQRSSRPYGAAERLGAWSAEAHAASGGAPRGV